MVINNATILSLSGKTTLVNVNVAGIGVSVTNEARSWSWCDLTLANGKLSVLSVLDYIRRQVFTQSGSPLGDAQLDELERVLVALVKIYPQID